MCVQLMSVVSETIGDVEGLHSKLERKGAVEKRNTDTAAHFQMVNSNTPLQSCHI